MNCLARFVSLSVLLSGIVSCGDIKKDKDGNVVAETSADIPLLPVDLPIYPTVLSLDGLFQSVRSSLDDLAFGIGSLVSDEKVNAGITLFGSKLEEASKGILQPGILSTSVSNQIKALEKVEVVSVGLSAELSNATGDFAKVPSQFSLYLGEKSKAEAFDETTRIPFTTAPALAEGSTDLPLVKVDGTKLMLKVDNVPHITTLLNRILKSGEAVEVGIGYKNLYRIADTSNQADLPTVVTKFGSCLMALAAQAAGVSVGFNPATSCPKPEQLLKWKINLHSLKLHVKVKAELFKVPAIPSCKAFSEANQLPNLKAACPEETPT